MQPAFFLLPLTPATFAAYENTPDGLQIYGPTINATDTEAQIRKAARELGMSYRSSGPPYVFALPPGNYDRAAEVALRIKRARGLDSITYAVLNGYALDTRKP